MPCHGPSYCTTWSGTCCCFTADEPCAQFLANQFVFNHLYLLNTKIRKFSPQSLDLASCFSLITLHPFLQHTFALPCFIPLLHIIPLYPHPVLYHCIALYPCLTPFHVFPHITSPPTPAVSISHKLLTTVPGYYHLPPDCTLRASLGLCFD